MIESKSNPTTKQESKARQGKRYTDSFKADAVELVLQPGAKLQEVARGLGVAVVTLRKWRDLATRPTGGNTPVPAGDLMAEIRRLQDELRSITTQRDILKKACGILSQPSRGTPQ